MTDPEFSRPFRIDTIGSEPHAVAIGAEPAERAALARRFDLLSIERLEATASLVRADDVVTATGAIVAAVTQACVASGAPVPATIEEPFTIRFAPVGPSSIEEMELAADDLDVMSYEGSAIDLGEAVAQTLALALDPFPRAPDADATLREAGVLEEGDAGPFGALKALRDRL
ncbi:YceD family protein [Sphingomonas nostoxanthinifaciens]|uniref:YceD family protein n=1 Tax=Sphingomonas nostoxanthinifaciens TaxID=2872652 RepID=UPI001CC1F5B2|nr:DUF177 domain-containing protein [Sphingomonas nostoxanthinifaciens]UAK25016.1 DUF177 domain-containing protein [Sphingomonas nostoxanthinifaciens]